MKVRWGYYRTSPYVVNRRTFWRHTTPTTNKQLRDWWWNNGSSHDNSKRNSFYISNNIRAHLVKASFKIRVWQLISTDHLMIWYFTLRRNVNTLGNNYKSNKVIKRSNVLSVFLFWKRKQRLESDVNVLSLPHHHTFTWSVLFS